MTSPSPEAVAAALRYESAMHGVQSGVAMLMSNDPTYTEADPKHLRVGVNSAMVESSALVKILIDKGIITDLEWYEALATMAEHERDLYQERVNALLGTDGKVTLG